MSSSEPADPDSNKTPPEKQNPGRPTQTSNADPPEAPSKEIKQKGEKRKAEPGIVTKSNQRRENQSHVVENFTSKVFCIVLVGWFSIDEDKNTNVYVSGLF